MDAQNSDIVRQQDLQSSNGTSTLRPHNLDLIVSISDDVPRGNYKAI
jgi:hypothetical protein